MSTFPKTREALHKLAEEVVSPARVKATGNEIALEARPGGFGTPAFPDGGEVRVEGTNLIVRAADGSETSEAINVDAADAERLAQFFSFIWGVLETLRAEAS